MQGQVFNSIVAIEQYQGAEMNPLVNAGAITTVSMVEGKSYDDICNKILNDYSDYAGRELTVWEDVYQSEADANQRHKFVYRARRGPNLTVGSSCGRYVESYRETAAGRAWYYPREERFSFNDGFESGNIADSCMNRISSIASLL